MPRRDLGAAALVVVAVAACRDLPRLEPDQCGNGVIEIGEDCDGATDPALGTALACAPPDSAAPCRYVCSDASCPAGWACGEDGVCRHATGQLVAGVAVALPHDDLAIADIDGDGAGDVVGFDPRGARIELGELTVVAASPDQVTGPGAAADLDGDGRADVVVPFSLGLAVARGETDHTVTPVGYATFGASTESWYLPVRIPDPSRADVLALLDPDGAGTLARILLMPEGTPEPGITLSPAITPLSFGPAAVRADLDPPSDADELVIAAAGQPRVWVLQMTWQQIILKYTIVPLPIAFADPGAVSDGRAAAADVDGDGDLDLVLGTITASGFGLAIATNTSTPGMLSFAPARADTPAGEALVAALTTPSAVTGVPSMPRPFPLAIGDLDGDGAVDAVSPDAVFTTARGGGLTPTYRRATAAPWREAVITDVDRLRGPDVVIAGSGPGLDLLRNGGGGMFARTAIDTAGEVGLLRGGDLDGDGLGDVAFRERSAAGDRIRVLFGAVGLPDRPPAILGAPGISRFEVGRFDDVFGGLDSADDMVAILRAPGRSGTAFVIGAGDRRLRSPLFLAHDNTGFDTPLGAAAGRFLSADGGADLAVLARDQDGFHHLWVFQAKPGAAYTVASATRLGPVDLGAVLAGLEVRRLGVADLDGDGRDELIVLGRGADPGASIVVTVSFPPAGPLVIGVFQPDVGDPLDLATGDLDRDGNAELVVAGTTGVVRWRAGSLDRAPVTGSSVCLAQLDDDAALELAVLASDGISIVDGDTLAGPITRVPAPAGSIVIRAGDLDGDGVDDLVVGDGVTVTRMRSLPQVAR